MRPAKETRDLCWGRFTTQSRCRRGVRFIEAFSTERQTKTRTGENPTKYQENEAKDV